MFISSPEPDREEAAAPAVPLRVRHLQTHLRRPKRRRHSNFANYACYPALNIMNGLNEAGMPTNVTFFARPFGEDKLLALGKAYQDAAGFHLKHPTKMEG